jgi:hypothetical protein
MLVAGDPVFVPEMLPCPPVLTRWGWMHFDKWGREVKLNPQPERPATAPVRRLCSYFKLRQKFLYLPPQMMKTEKARKKAIAEQKKQAKIFFLPAKEKQKILMREHTDKLWAKKSKKHKEQASATGKAFAKEFGGFLTAKQLLEKPSPPKQQQREKALCACKGVTLTCLTCGFEPCLCLHELPEGLTNEEERMCDKCGKPVPCQDCKCQPCFCGDQDFGGALTERDLNHEGESNQRCPAADYDPMKTNEEREIEAAKKIHKAGKPDDDESESENEWDGGEDDDLVCLG